jgi:hypothetical protein
MVDYSYLGCDRGSCNPILVWDFGQGVVTKSMQCDDSPTLAHVFALFDNIKLDMVEEKVVTLGFCRDIATTYCGQQSTSKPCSGGGGSRGGQV